MLACRLSALWACCFVAPLLAAGAEIDPQLTRIIRHIPRSDTELATLHEHGSDQVCEPINDGLPLEVAGFNEAVTHRRPEAPNGSPPVAVLESSRRGVLSFGMDMTPDDQQQLPLLSGGKILAYVNRTYISIQVRVERDTPSGEPFLHFRLTAAQGDYANRHTTTPFTAMLRESVGQVRGLGLYLKPGQAATAENLRTLVALHRSLADDAWQAELEAKGVTGREPHFELLCVRARVGGQSTERQVTLHAFATTEDRTRLRYLPAYRMPSKAADCSIKSTIYFTSYGFANLYPAGKSTRRIAINDQASFAMADLDRYASGQGWEGDALANLSEILDAIIDGRIR